MASDFAERSTGDPAHDANYDYRSDEVARPDLLSALEARVAGDVRFDTYSRQLYATDASAYETTPIGVVFPESTADVSAVMTYCAEREIPVLPRGGGTSLAGQAVNEAVVLDFTRHMSEFLDVDPDAGTARAQPGIYLADIDEELAPSDLKFAPDPAWGDKSALGGAIGNNSTGAHSLKYGKTDAYIESCEVVLADGTVTEFGERTIEELRERADPDGDLEAQIHAAVVRIIDEETEEIEEAYPDMKRNVSGYDLDMLVEDAAEGTVNLGRLLAGSEGTLAIVTEATVSLEPVPETKAVALLTYDSLGDAMEDVTAILEHDPAAVEVMDDVLLDLARDTSEFADVVGMLPEGTDSVLLVEFYADSDDEGKQKTADLIADRVPDGDSEAEPSGDADESTETDHHAVAAMEAHDSETRAQFWKMRKSGLPILLSRTTDEKHISFIEDCAVPAEHLSEYVAGFQDILEEQGTFASFYAHAGPGVLHVRPLINSKTVEGLEQMEQIADGATDLVVEYGGSVSGEHGDGRARTQWNEKLYGEHLWEVFRDLKSTFDPDWLLNPGQVCGLPAESESGESGATDAPDLTGNLRFDPDYEFDAGFDTELRWENDNGFQGMAELCHGCGGCRGHQSTTGGVMCPTYRAANEEILSTRGRANALRQAMSGDLGRADEAFDVEFMNEVMDLCIGCKGCANDCPSEVDMAKMKVEVTNEYHQRHGASLRDHLFANIDSLSALGSRFAPLSNWGTKLPGARTLLEKTVGIAKDRTLPTFHSESFEDWFEARGGPAVSAAEAERKALLFPDTYMNYNHPDAAKATVSVLEAAGVHVRLPLGVTDSGRPAFSKGFIEKARTAAEQNVAALSPLVRRDWDVVVVEPSDAVMFQYDYPDLLPAADRSIPTGTVAAGESGEQPATDGGEPSGAGRTSSDSLRSSDGGTRNVETVAQNTYGMLEYLDRFRLDENIEFAERDESLTYHGHCHQKSTKKDHHAVGVLRRAGYAVDPLDSGCCGMAGSFGYEAEHLSMSRAIADVLYEQVEASNGDSVVAPGASCRAQLGEHEGEEPPHPIEKVADALAN